MTEVAPRSGSRQEDKRPVSGSTAAQLAADAARRQEVLNARAAEAKYLQSLGSTAMVSALPYEEKLQKFVNTRVAHRMRPINYRPNGSFKELKRKGKLQTYEAFKSRDLTATTEAEDTPVVPGYTGFLRGSQHIRGRTFGETTRRATQTPYRDLVTSSPIPSNPQNSRKVEQQNLTHTFVGSYFTNRAYHVPGYTGHVPGVRSQYGRSYGSSTTAQLGQSDSVQLALMENPGMAGPMKSKRTLTLDSAPLPGAPKTEVAPHFLVPTTVKHLKFLSA